MLTCIVERGVELSNPKLADANSEELQKLIMALISLLNYNQTQGFLSNCFFTHQIAIRRFKTFIFT